MKIPKLFDIRSLSLATFFAAAIGFNHSSARCSAQETLTSARMDSSKQLSMMLDCIAPYYPQGNVQGNAVLAGSAPMMLLGQEWANKFRQYHSSVVFTRAPETAATALDALKQDPTAIAGVAHMITAKELDALRSSKCKDPTVVVVGLEPIAILVHKDNPLQAVTPEQLQVLLSQNAQTTWAQAGVTGPLAQKPVRIHGRGDQNSTKEFIESTILAGRPMASFAATHRSQAELLAEAAKDPASLALGGIRDAEGVRPLSLIINGNEIAPSENAFLAGEYPLVRPLTLVFDKSLIEADNGLRREILSYVLSRQGQEEVLRAGFFPVNPNFIAQQMASFSKSQLR